MCAEDAVDYCNSHELKSFNFDKSTYRLKRRLNVKQVIGWIVVIAIAAAVGYMVVKTKEENREYNKGLMIEGK